ncbi:2-oxo-4-hydroxy-4-carboxy-5-ureidoimidazoline decarboxylase [Planctomyces bekefii]|uniref:2-oxo-4-hydroxy-4-carboxy-5-ureidoimidazoline decarboxylase n=1 Tax=Planctomyces bekefii TaxID=1653850 RepID=A0A5C6MHP0_9PLAN|nr:2-oxo-4-hydroxy-4-carboxy-5-ureidoimidazoline decarboxylase [Planctomyces bekefii]
MDLERLNQADQATAESWFFHCLGVRQWAQSMTRRRPFANATSLIRDAEDMASKLPRDAWLAAFQEHPKIGDLQSLKKRFQSTAHLASHEQASVHAASEQVIAELAAGNAAYEDKFGFIFIICATGKSASEMLTSLKARLGNPRDQEMQTAWHEQLKITKLRLEKIGDV